MGNVAHLVEARPRNGGEVMMLVVQPDVVGEDVAWSVVREGLGHGHLVVRVPLLRGHGLVYVVLRDEVTGERVQGASEERGEDEVEERIDATRSVDNIVEGRLNSDVQEVDASERHAVDEHRAEGVEEDLECAEEGLPEDGVKEHGFKSGREVGIQAIDAKGLVVGEMIGLWCGQYRHNNEISLRGGVSYAEGCAVGDADG